MGVIIGLLFALTSAISFNNITLIQPPELVPREEIEIIEEVETEDEATTSVCDVCGQGTEELYLRNTDLAHVCENCFFVEV